MYPRESAWLDGLLLLYAAASLLHFVHNAEYLADYPNLPTWLSRADVYLVWLALAAIGAAGWALYRFGQRLAGLLLIGTYAAVGFDGLLHYTRAPLAAHEPRPARARVPRWQDRPYPHRRQAHGPLRRGLG